MNSTTGSSPFHFQVSSTVLTLLCLYSSLTIFYIFYILVEIPSNEVFRRVGSMWLAALVIVFGVVSIATAFVHNLAGVIVTRIFLGLSEGGRKSFNTRRCFHI